MNKQLEEATVDRITIAPQPEIIGYWAYGNNKKDAINNKDISLNLTKRPPRRTIWMMSLFNIYWIDK